MSLNKTLLVLCTGVALLAGCRNEQAEPTESAAPAIGAPAQDAPAAAPEPAPVSEAPAAPFDPGTLPVSGEPLGEFPYLAPPEGYLLIDAQTRDLARVPFWTGANLEFVEGRVHEVRIQPIEGKTYSRFEVLKRLDQALTGLGATRITTSEIPGTVLDNELPKDFGVEFNAGAGGYYSGAGEVSTYVIRRPDRIIWMKVFSDTIGGSVLVAETEPATAAAPTGEAAAAPQ